MITKRSSQYFTGRKTRYAQPIKNKEDVQKSNDNKSDEDFPGFPHGQSKENIINPVNGKDKKVAGVNKQDGEKVNKHAATEESSPDGSASAFDATEKVSE